jgi:periplasmic divalent cation tolerance protein
LKPVIVLTTVGADFDPKPLARELVEARLAACVNIIPAVQSVYRWEGKVAEEGEQLLLIKTVDERLDELQAKLFERHPYEVPEFAVMTIDEIRGAWREWLLESVR